MFEPTFREASLRALGADLRRFGGTLGRVPIGFAEALTLLSVRDMFPTAGGGRS
jgi:hypothetical protein